jgi:hypothetical protein
MYKIKFSKTNILLIQQVKVAPEFAGLQNTVILDPNGMTFDAVGVFGPTIHEKIQTP